MLLRQCCDGTILLISGVRQWWAKSQIIFGHLRYALNTSAAGFRRMSHLKGQSEPCAQSCFGSLFVFIFARED